MGFQNTVERPEFFPDLLVGFGVADGVEQGLVVFVDDHDCLLAVLVACGLDEQRELLGWIVGWQLNPELLGLSSQLAMQALVQLFDAIRVVAGV